MLTRPIRLSLDGNPSVAVGIRKQSGANTVALIKSVKQRMAQIIPTLPKDFKVAVVRDQSEFIENILHAIEEHLVLGGAFRGRSSFPFPLEFSIDDHCGPRDTDLDHRGVRR